MNLQIPKAANYPAAMAASSLLAWLASSIVLGVVWLELGGGALSPPVCGAILLLAMVAAAALLRSHHVLRLTLAAVAVTAFAVAIAGLALDTSFDGQEYHYDATWALLHGWNPAWRSFAQYVPPGGSALPWPDHYAWGSWLLLALVQGAGLSSEAAKGVFVLPAMAAGLAWFAALDEAPVRPFVRAALAVLAASSPTVLVELPTRMNDGVMASLAACYVAFGLIWMHSRSVLALGSMITLLVLAVLIKFNALAIFGALTAGFCIAAYGQAGWRSAGRFGLLMGGVTVASMVTLGWHPYVTNLIGHGNPFWPVGAPQYEVNGLFLPDWLRQAPVVVQSAYSLASRVGQVLVPKWPFMVSKAELGSLSGDTYWGAFGPWFSGALLLALVAGGATVLSRRARRDHAALLWVAGLALVSAAAVPQSWIARFVPQLWLAAFLLGVAALGLAGRDLAGRDLAGRGLAAPDRRARLLRGIGAACLLALAVNSTLVLLATGYAESKATLAVDQSLDFAKEAGEVCAYFGASHARIGLLQANGISVDPLHSPPNPQCKGASPLPYVYDFFGPPPMSCPCDEVAHDPPGVWRIPPDTTAQDIAKQWRHAGQ